jgi:hypothetical protein
MLILPQMSHRLSLQDARFGVMLEGECNQGGATWPTFYPKNIKDN